MSAFSLHDFLIATVWFVKDAVRDGQIQLQPLQLWQGCDNQDSTENALRILTL